MTVQLAVTVQSTAFAFFCTGRSLGCQRVAQSVERAAGSRVVVVQIRSYRYNKKPPDSSGGFLQTGTSCCLWSWCAPTQAAGKGCWGRRRNGRGRIPVHARLECIRTLRGNCGIEIRTIYGNFRRRVLKATRDVGLAGVCSRGNGVRDAGATPFGPRGSSVTEQR